MEELIQKLNEAAKAYYGEGHELMDNFEYDKLYDQLEAMEKETGIVLPNSPTRQVGFVVMDKLPKVQHEVSALSLDKTKDIDEIAEIFCNNKDMAVVMPKWDGGSAIAVYQNGKLKRLATRGNGTIGSDISHNAKYIKGLPQSIPYKGKVIVRGEVVMSYSEFERINDSLPENEEPYKNPRNLANSTVSLLNSQEMSEREIWFQAYTIMSIDEPVSPDTYVTRLAVLKGWGFNITDFVIVETKTELLAAMKYFTKQVTVGTVFPWDGIVVASNNIAEAEKLPGTGKFPNKLVGYAFKWADEPVQTTLRKIEFGTTRTGIVAPVAIFDSVEIEQTSVSRATLHNLSYIKSLNLKVGDVIEVVKQNMIIPAVVSNLTKHEEIDVRELITHCPVCHRPIEIQESVSGTIVAKCVNEECPARNIGLFTHFCERDCMNIDGMSEATIQKFVSAGFLNEFTDFYYLDRYKEQIVTMEGFGEKSYENIISAVEVSRNTDFVSFIHALGIPNVGKGQGKLLRGMYGEDILAFFKDGYEKFDFKVIDGIGDVICSSIHSYVEKHMPSGPQSDNEITRLLKELQFPEKKEEIESTLAGKIFVITGSVNKFSNRDELTNFIESKGGKTSGSVSKNTTFLINNDVSSTTGKNKKALELGVKIINEDQFMELVK